MTVYSGLVVIIAYFRDKKLKRNSNASASFRQPSTWEDNTFALEIIGEDSTYSFMFSKSWVGLTIVAAVMAVQMWMLFEFMIMAQFDFENGERKFVYSFKCPRDST